MPSAQELQYQYALRLEQTQNLEKIAFEKIAANLLPPRKGKYIFAAILAILGDLIDLLDLTGIGEVVTLLADFIIDPVLTWLGFKMNKAVKHKEKASEDLNGMIENLHQKIEGYRNAYQMLGHARSKLASLKRTGRKMKLGLKLKKPKPIKKRGVLGKIFLGQLIDFIPLAELYPARTHSVWSAYKAEKAIYQEGQEIIKDYLAAEALQLAEQVEYFQLLSAQQENLEVPDKFIN